MLCRILFVHTGAERFSDAWLYGGVNHKGPEDLELQSSNFDAWPYGVNLLPSKPLRFPRVCQRKKCECQFISDSDVSSVSCEVCFVFLYNDRATLRGVSVSDVRCICMYVCTIYTYVYI